MLEMEAPQDEEVTMQKTNKAKSSAHLNGGNVSLNKKTRRKQKRSFIVQNGEEEKEYEVENIICHEEVNGKVTRYRVKWKGWSEDQCTWEPIENMRGCLEMVVAYFEKAVYPGRENIPFKSRVETLRISLSQFKDEDFIDKSRLYFTLEGQCIPKVDDEKTEFLLEMMARLPPSARDNKVIQEIHNSFLSKKLVSLRNDQLGMLKEWENDINTISTDSAPILVRNTVDLEGPPLNFTYVNTLIPGFNVSIPFDPLVGCECKNCPQGGCCVRLCEENSVYTNKGILKVKSGTPVYECNKRCKCGPNCTNRVVQHGRKIPLCIFRTGNGCGWGVQTLKDIQKGEFVTEYVGEVIRTEDAERRGKKYDKDGITYLFDLDFNIKNCPYAVDAAVYGNVSHFINHSCNPNLVVIAVWVNCLDPNIPHLALFALRNIKQNEELTLDYLCQSVDNKRNSKDYAVNSSNYICKCGSHNCRKFLF